MLLGELEMQELLLLTHSNTDPGMGLPRLTFVLMGSGYCHRGKVTTDRTGCISVEVAKKSQSVFPLRSDFSRDKGPRGNQYPLQIPVELQYSGQNFGRLQVQTREHVAVQIV